jgi:DNA polymerase-3 subunit alpha
VLEPDWPGPERLAREKAPLGFYLSGHPVESYRALIDAIGSGSLKSLIGQQSSPMSFEGGGGGGGGGDDEDGPVAAAPRRRPRRTPVVVGVWLADVRNVGGDRPGKLLTLDDATAQVICWIDSELWMRYQTVLKKDTLIFIVGDLGLSQREGRDAEWRLYAREFQNLDNVLRERIESLTLHCQAATLDLSQLRRCLEPLKAQYGAKIAVEYRNGRSKGSVDFGAGWCLRADWDGLNRLKRLLGPDQVCVNYRKWRPPVSKSDYAGAE